MKKELAKRLNGELVLLLLLLFFGIYSLILIYFTTAGQTYNSDNHLVLLAERFSQWKVSLDPINRPEGDVVDYFANFYLYFGPFPSLALMPLVMIWGREFPQICLGVFSLLISFLAVYRIGAGLGYNEKDSLWLSIFFGFSTVLLGVSVVNITAYQVQALGTSLVLLSLAEYFNKRRFWLVGLGIALAGLTRMVLFMGVVFFLGEWWRERKGKRELVKLILPILAGLLLLGAYNHRRFNSVWESGYRYNVTLKTWPMQENLRYGMFSLKQVPANLFSLLMKTPEPILEYGGGYVLKFPYFSADPWGLAIWFTSPLLLLLIRNERSQYSRSAMLAATVLAIPVLTYSGVGFMQFGYRYALDFLPFLFLLLLPCLGKRLGRGAKLLIIGGVIFNCVYLASLWNIYPHFFMEYKNDLVIGDVTSQIRGRWIE